MLAFLPRLSFFLASFKKLPHVSELCQGLGNVGLHVVCDFKTSIRCLFLLFKAQINAEHNLSFL